MFRKRKFTGPSEFGGSDGVVQPALTPDGNPGHTPTPSEMASLERRTADPSGSTLHESLSPSQITEAWNGLDPLNPTPNMIEDE